MDKNTVLSVPTNAGAGLLAGEEYGRKLTIAAGEIKRFEDGRPYRIRENGEVEIVERLLPGPIARKGEVTFYEALSFSAFVTRFKNASTVIFADSVGRKFTAALDYNPQGGDSKAAMWDQFRALLPLRHTESWTTWAKVNGVKMTQADFAQFIEDQIPDIAEPAGAKLVEIARTLEAKTDVQFESHIRADNGAHRFAYLENVQGTASGNVEIPQEFKLVLQPFDGSKQYPVTARFRYRITAKQLTMWFDLVRLQDVLEEAFNDELLKIAEKVGTETPIFKGPAPAAQVPANKATSSQE